MEKKAKIIIIVLIAIILIVLVATIVNLLNLKDNSSDDSEAYEPNINSKELKNTLENKWDKDKIDYGKKDSYFQDYDIYFDEGLEVRTIEGKVYNLVFTEKYKKNVIDKVKVNDNLDSVIEKLGDPDFGGTSINIIGYKYSNYYIFFTGKQISVYRNDSNIKSVEDIFGKQYNSAEEFINNITSIWPDYDTYTVSELNGRIYHCLLNYTQKGIRISYQDEQMQITAYNNCDIKIDENSIYHVVSKNKNLVYEVEIERQNSVHNREFAYAEFQSTVNNLPPDFEVDEKSEFKVIQSEKFIFIETGLNASGEHKLAFLSIDGEYANSEIDETVLTNIWVDNFNVIYSVKNKGIYLYNLKTMEKTILKEGNNDFFIYGITNDNMLKYDNSEIKINL